MISWVVKGSLEASRVAESVHIFCDCEWEKLEIPWVLTEPDFHTVVDSRIREYIDIPARVRPELSEVLSRTRTDQGLEER
jgi:hypothetical protein